MKCRIGCGACCIEPSISEAIPGMPHGKPAGVRCINLDENNCCRIWGQANYPKVCRKFTPNPDFCGNSNKEAMTLIAAIEEATRPDPHYNI